MDIKGVRYVDIFAFTSKIEQIEDKKLKAFIKSDTENIRLQIETWNKQVYESSFARNFKKIFVKCKAFYEDVINEESRKLTRLNTSITKLAAEDIESEILEPLQLMIKEGQRKVNELKDTSRKLKELQDQFFTEIKFIADIVGIVMPEPSEIDLLQEKVQNPLELIEEYKRQKGIRTDNSVVDMLQGIFDGIEPVINKCAGGSEYKNELLDIIMSTCDVKPEDIHINDVYKNTQEYIKLINNV